MDIENQVLNYGIAYLISFSFLYSYFYFSIELFLLIYILLALINLPSLLVSLALLFFSIKRKIKIYRIIYFFLSFSIFPINLFIYKHLTYDPRNLFPIFEEPLHSIFLLCFISNCIAFLYLELLLVFFKKNSTLS